MRNLQFSRNLVLCVEISIYFGNCPIDLFVKFYNFLESSFAFAFRLCVAISVFGNYPIDLCEIYLFEKFTFGLCFNLLLPLGCVLGFSDFFHVKKQEFKGPRTV